MEIICGTCGSGFEKIGTTVKTKDQIEYEVWLCINDNCSSEVHIRFESNK